MCTIIIRDLFRIFYLEDDPDLAEDLRVNIADALPGTVVEWADNIEDGLALLNRKNHFDLGLLDVRVPRRKNKNPEAHPDVALALRQKNIALLIYTGYLQSPDVQEFLTQKLTDPPLAVIAKRVGHGLTEEIVREVRGWFVKSASSRITNSIHTLFDKPWDTGRSFRGTGAVLGLQQEIADYWPYLNSSARHLVATRFHVNESDGVIDNLTLIPRTG